MPDLDELRSLSHRLVPPAYDAMVDTARRRDRRAAAVITAGVASAVAAMLAVVMVATGPDRDGSRIDPAPLPTPSRSVTPVPPDEAAAFAPDAPPPLPTDVSPFGDSSEASKTVEVRMFVTGPPLKQHRACFNRKSPPECLAVEPPLQPLGSTDVEFGISVYEHWAPAVAEVAGEAVGALASIDGVDYVLSQVIQGPGDSVLQRALDPSGPELLVAVLDQASDAMVACGTAAGADRQAYRRCHPSLELLLGNRSVALKRGTFGAPGDFPRVSFGRPIYRVPAGTTGRVEIKVTAGPPENANHGLLVFEAAE